jgi:dolichol-phosphate mannosyltransferase
MRKGSGQLAVRTTIDERADPIDVTIVLPAYNEQDTINGTIDEISATMDPTGLDYEFLFVDDGSTDETWVVIQEAAARNSRVHALRHRGNEGKASALANGFAFARGNVVALCDADLQYEPEDVLRVIDKVYEGYDAVTANKIVRRDSLERRLPSKFFNFFVRKMTGVRLHDMNAGLKAFRYDAAQELIRFGYGELHRFFMVILALKGYSVAEIPVESRPRPTGKSKYGFERYMRGGLDFLTVFFLSGYLERPLHLFGGWGLALGAIGALGIVASIVAALATGNHEVSTPILESAELFIVLGVQLFAIGMLAEMVNNLEHGPRPTAEVAAVIGVERRRNGTARTPHLERRAPRSADVLAKHGVDVADEASRCAPEQAAG